MARERSFAALHSENYERIYRYIAYRISDADRAEELAGDVFRIAWEKDLPEGPGIGWLIATARNVVANEYKGRSRRQLLREGLQERMRVAAATNDNESGAVADVLAKLNQRHREVLMLAYWDGLTTAELAESLGCSHSAAGVRLHRRTVIRAGGAALAAAAVLTLAVVAGRQQHSHRYGAVAQPVCKPDRRCGNSAALGFIPAGAINRAFLKPGTRAGRRLAVV